MKQKGDLEFPGCVRGVFAINHFSQQKVSERSGPWKHRIFRNRRAEARDVARSGYSNTEIKQ